MPLEPLINTKLLVSWFELNEAINDSKFSKNLMCGKLNRPCGYDPRRNKGITNITYNHLNLPVTIYFADESKITYLYNATGQKVGKKVIQATNITNTDYLTGFQYKNTVLQFFPHAEGYVNATETENGTSYRFNYVYNYTDHLGNIRLSYSLEPSTNVLKIIEENHYYPFGLKHTGYNSDKMMYVKEASELKIKPMPPLFKTSYNYKYNGKEYQDELGLNMYDYGARNYMADIGRWGSIDPLAEKFPAWSPYNFCMNNPIYFIDPDGREVQKPPLRGTKEFNSFVKDVVNKNSSSVNWSDKDGTWRYDAKKQSWIGIDESKGNNIRFDAYKTSTTHKVIKSGVVLANAYGGYNEVVAGVGALLAPEPTGVTKAIGLYGIADGATRILSSPIALYGTMTENEMLENVPSNVLGLVGNIIDNINSPYDSYTTGGSVQFWGELTGDFGLSRRNLINTLEKEATTNMDKIIKGGKIVKDALFLPVNGTIKSKKLQENE